MRDLMHALMMDAADLAGPLPEMVFFRPTEKFFWFLDKKFHRDKPIIDMGAGTGHLTKALIENGRKAMAIDPFDRDGRVWPVAPLDATTLDYPAHCLPIMARPCHGVWIELAITQAMKTVKRMLYIGLEKNFEKDLDWIEGKLKVSKTPWVVGMDGERVVMIDKP